MSQPTKEPAKGKRPELQATGICARTTPDIKMASPTSSRVLLIALISCAVVSRAIGKVYLEEKFDGEHLSVSACGGTFL